MRTFTEHVPVPEDFGTPLIGVKPGSDMDLELRFEAVHEGILVSGSAFVEVTGECSRCLDPLVSDLEVNVQELFFYEEPSADDLGEDEDEQRWVEHDSIDLEPVLRDAVVTALPFQPVCREDCEGLCSECGIHLADEPGHHHEVLDPRWAALQGLTGEEN
ncbi:YceD family protein [Specibacter sp. RAF43]|uniref:YceD family protein n=1 Tax=Specibacter sp. RAF43 TaxID=3233057 RepID=UPI003F9B9A82